MPLNLESITGCILGTAVGDALGLPYEGLSRKRARKLFGPPDRHRLVFGRGLVSDDTEHTCMVAQALIAAGDDVNSFARSLSWRLRIWLLGLPPGIGKATLLAILKLYLGFPPGRNGVFSAGNGPAMRSAILGAAIEDLSQLKELVRASTHLTHTDPKAEQGALAVALAARFANAGAPPNAQEFVAQLKELLADQSAAEFLKLMDHVLQSHRSGETTEVFATSMGLENGVSGYMFHTVPVMLHAWLRNPHDFRAAVTDVILCGGDADSTAAIVGGIVGCAVGEKGIPVEWLNGICDWPRTVGWMRRLAIQLDRTRANATHETPLSLPAWGVLPRNLALLMIAFAHVCRRWLPPY